MSALTTRRENDTLTFDSDSLTVLPISVFPHSRNTMTSPSAAVKAEPLRGGALAAPALTSAAGRRPSAATGGTGKSLPCT